MVMGQASERPVRSVLGACGGLEASIDSRQPAVNASSDTANQGCCPRERLASIPWDHLAEVSASIATAPRLAHMERESLREQVAKCRRTALLGRGKRFASGCCGLVRLRRASVIRLLGG